MSRFVLSIHVSPKEVGVSLSLVHFAEACIHAGHHIDAILFYQEGVYHASDGFNIPSDETDLKQAWQTLHQKHNIPLLLCITACEKHGVSYTEKKPFTVSGLAEFATLAADADRWVQFK